MNDVSSDKTSGARWRTIRRVKSGSGVETFLGQDLRDGAAVIVKAASAVSPLTQQRLEHEAEVLRAARRCEP